jgi:hypothetical protein
MSTFGTHRWSLGGIRRTHRRGPEDSWEPRQTQAASGTLSEPGMRVWTPSNDLAQSRRRASSATEVPGCQWDALKPL